MYEELIEAAEATGKTLDACLSSALPDLWCAAYADMPGSRPTNIYVIARGTFDYIFDDHATLEASGAVQGDSVSESRVVGTIGRSAPRERPRDDYRLQGWLGPTEALFGKEWDKGHFIAHSMGGAVDGSELNVFVQLRSLNRGWSDEGRQYRRMEEYCATHPGVLCWSRPIYEDETARPAQLEFGLVRVDGSVWVEVFQNR